MNDPTPPGPVPATQDAEPSPARGLLSDLKWVLWTALAFLAIQNLVAKPYYIPSVSMMPTLLTGDRLLATKYPYGWSWASAVPRLVAPRPGRLLGRLPERGDVVTVAPPGHEDEGDYIKRVIGLPGDVVALRHGRLWLNGVPTRRVAAGTTDIVADPNTTCTEGDQKRFRVRARDGVVHCRLPVFRETLPSGQSYDTLDLGYVPAVDDYGPIRVPAGRVFLMGDNRDQSSDSRVDVRHMGLGGPVPVENLSARAEFVTFSLTGRLLDGTPDRWWPLWRPGRAGIGLRPSATR
jgi:signal peptidase I